MKYGIFRHGILKTFLTRGLLRSIFRPILYTKADHIHYEFINVMTEFAIKIEKEIKPNNTSLITFWLMIVPKYYFEMIFVESDNGKANLKIVRNATKSNGKECAYITQAFILWNLQQILKNKQDFQKAMGFSIKDLENIVNEILGQDNKVIHYLNNYRNKFDIKKLEVDPRDWSIIYIWDICEALIPNKIMQEEVMYEWDKNIIEKMKLITFTVKFLGNQTRIALEMSKDN